MATTDIACRTAKPYDRIRKISDGGGLQLWVNPNGSKVWRLAYRVGGKQKTLTIGPYPSVSLAEARVSREDAKRSLRTGVDPSRAKQEAKGGRVVGATFEMVAEDYIEKLRREGRKPATITKNEWLLGLARQSIGKRPIAQLSRKELLVPLKEV